MNSQPPVDPQLYEQFLRFFTRDQVRLLAWIRSLIPESTAANDVFQETSLELWRSFPTFRQDCDFLPWALGVARHQVLKHWRTTKRDRHFFSEPFLSELATEAIDLSNEMSARQSALEKCIERLSDRQHDLIRRFYGENEPAGVIAEAWDRSVHAVYKALKVMRRALFDCVETRLAGENRG